ncbi:DUF3192 domain-containing protein [Endozoicomonadaceae bacterium StTr2]
MIITRFVKCILVLCVVILAGCSIKVGNTEGGSGHKVSAIEKADQVRREKISRLNAGELLADVKVRLGVPDFTELYKVNNQEVRVLYYRTHRVKADNYTTKDECTPLVFIENKLDGWGSHALDKVTNG